MSEIALYNALTKLGLKPDEAEKAVADVVSSKEAASKTDIVKVETSITEVKAEIKAIKSVFFIATICLANLAILVSLMLR